MGKPGQQSRRGEGEKEPDKTVRDSLLKVKIPRWKLEKLKHVATRRGISLTDIVSDIIGIFLSNNAEDLTQKDADRGEGYDP